MILAFSGCGPEEGAVGRAEAPPPVLVATAPVERRPASAPVRAAGVIRAAEETMLSFPLGGIIAEVNARAGDRVRKGQVLARLDRTTAEAQLAQARAGLAKAERDAGRAAQLEGAVIGTAQREDAGTALDVARQTVTLAEFQARRSAIVAPSDGVILHRLADADEAIGPGMPVFTFAREGGFELLVTVAGPVAMRLASGDEATVDVAGVPAPLSGRVSHVAGGATPTGTWPVQIAVEAPASGARLASGLTGQAVIRPAPAPLAVVPVAAVTDGAGHAAAVFTPSVDGATARRVPIEVAFLEGTSLFVASGLDGVDRVIVQGAPWLSDGAPITQSPAR